MQWSSTNSFKTEVVAERPSSVMNSPTPVDIHEDSGVALGEWSDPRSPPREEIINLNPNAENSVDDLCKQME
ncbi:hypothetical protein MLD38_003509 [Melastoma candidum]|uniref:Uncharacterized protein n=1 Tax=Melastoma candidum TaxID=119954 RepID=A0ACB9S457_9MYRT|nr:hypothetical protein MLD38_003509 [Melastoma candidum]